MLTVDRKVLTCQLVASRRDVGQTRDGLLVETTLIRVPFRQAQIILSDGSRVVVGLIVVVERGDLCGLGDLALWNRQIGLALQKEFESVATPCFH